MESEEKRCEKLKKEIKELLDKKQYEYAWKKLRGAFGENGYFESFLDDELAALFLLSYIMQKQYLAERKYGEPVFSWESGEKLIEGLNGLKLFLWRLEYDIPYGSNSVKFDDLLPYAVEVIGECTCLNKDKVFKKVANLYYNAGKEDWAAYFYEKCKRENRDICFIVCVNNELYYEECKTYIESLYLPSETKIEILPVRNATSMAAAYNEAMMQSKAKYKVYLHQDVFIINKNFITDIIRLFETNEEIGMIGLAGTKKLPQSGIWWYGEEKDSYGQIYEANLLATLKTPYQDIKNKKYEEVEALDGLLLATSVDIPWREELFDGWHFYDISQSFEMQRHGYKLIIPRTDTGWVIHDVDLRRNVNAEYEVYRERFLKEYILEGEIDR